MKWLYYNEIEIPQKVKIKSSCFQIDTEYNTDDSNVMPCLISDLFDLAQSKYFEDVQVYLTTHNDAYIKESKTALVGTAVKGWISLKKCKNAGGYLKDSYCIKIN